MSRSCRAAREVRRYCPIAAATLFRHRAAKAGESRDSALSDGHRGIAGSAGRRGRLVVCVCRTTHCFPRRSRIAVPRPTTSTRSARHFGAERVTEGGPADISARSPADLERAVAEVLRLLHLRAEMVVAVIGPPAVDSGAFHDGETVAGVKRIECREVVALGGRKECANGGGDTRVATRAGIGCRGGSRCRRRGRVLSPRGMGYEDRGECEEGGQAEVHAAHGDDSDDGGGAGAARVPAAL